MLAVENYFFLTGGIYVHKTFVSANLTLPASVPQLEDYYSIFVLNTATPFPLLLLWWFLFCFVNAGKLLI